MIEAALDLLEVGFAVLPVAQDGRSPLVGGGCHSASREPDQVRNWWTRWPQANVAVACGPASNVLALDVDRHGDVDGVAALKELCAEFGPLPRTVKSRTPNGGCHLLFAHPECGSPQNRVGIKRYSADGARRVYRGLDVRAAGASICVPPSVRPAGAYEWERCPFSTELATIPNWLLALMMSEPPPRPSTPIRASGGSEKLAKYVVSAVNGECSAVAGTPPQTGRNQRLFIAAARLGELIGAGLLPQDAAEAALERAASECGLVQDDGLRSVRLTIASGIKRGVANPREVAA